jgi:hypothetical protein
MRLILLLLALSLATPTPAEVLFTDDFNSGASADWGNELGDWTADGGVYFALSPSTNPPAYTSVTVLPELTDFTVEFDVNEVNDGGVFLRSRLCDNGQVEGVLLVIGGWNGSHNGVYWHEWDCSGHGPILGMVEIPDFQGTNAHVLVAVDDSTYSAYVNDSNEPTSSIVTNRFVSGSVGLYQYLPQSFDNFRIYDHAVSGVPSEELSVGSVLLGNRPNPFYAQTEISFCLPSSAPVDLAVYDVSGRLVAQLLRGSFHGPGDHRVTWDGRDSEDRRVAAGVYFCRLIAEGATDTKGIVLLR